MHPHTLCLSLNKQKMPGWLAGSLADWLAGCSGASLTWIPSDACFCTPIIQLGGRMARALLHTPVRSCAKTPGHGVIVGEGIHYMMLPACADKKRQDVTCRASQCAQWQCDQRDSTGGLLRSTNPWTNTLIHTEHILYAKNMGAMVENNLRIYLIYIGLLWLYDCCLYLCLEHFRKNLNIWAEKDMTFQMSTTCVIPAVTRFQPS